MKPAENTALQSGTPEIGGLPELGSHPDMSKHWQQGYVFLREGVRRSTWYGVYRKPQIRDSKIQWVQVKEALGTDKELKTEKAARRKLADILATINNPDYRATCDITFEKFVEKWRISHLPQLGEQTRGTYNSALRAHLLPYFGKVKMADLNSMLVQQLITAKSSLGRSSSTVRNIIVAMRSVWGDAQSSGYAPKTLDPFDGIRLPEDDEASEVAYFTDEQINRIFDAAEEPYRTMYQILAATGMRAGELFGLKWEDIKGCVLTVRRSITRSGSVKLPKSKKTRTFVITNSLAEKLELMRGEGWVFQHEGLPRSQKHVREQHLQPLLEKLGIPQAGFHAFRHGNATILDEENVPLKVRQQRLGHSTPMMTDRYTHVVSADDKAAAEAIGRRLRIQ